MKTIAELKVQSHRDAKNIAISLMESGYCVSIGGREYPMNILGERQSNWHVIVREEEKDG